MIIQFLLSYFHIIFVALNQLGLYTCSTKWFFVLVIRYTVAISHLCNLSATTTGGGSATPRRRKVARRPSSMTWSQCSLSRHRPPGPVGLGRRMAKSTGTMSLPSPITTMSRTPLSCPKVAVGFASGPQSRPPSFPGGSSHGEPAPRP
jgi:hypothetical protein